MTPWPMPAPAADHSDHACQTLFESRQADIGRNIPSVPLDGIIVLVVLTTFVALQWRSDQLIQESIKAEALRLEAISTALAETRQQALSAEELETLRDQLDMQLSSNTERLTQLERRLGASARVIRRPSTPLLFCKARTGCERLRAANYCGMS